MVKNTDAFDNKKIKVPFVVPTINSDDKNQILRHYLQISSRMDQIYVNLKKNFKIIQNLTSQLVFQMLLLD